MSCNFSTYKINNAIPAIYGTFLRSYKPPGKFVPFSHFRQAFFPSRRDRIPAVRKAGIAILPLDRDFSFPAPAVCAELLSLEQLTAKTQEIYEKTTDLKARSSRR